MTVQVDPQVEQALQAAEAQKDVKAAIIAVARENGTKVTFRGLITRVKLADGTTGKAKCDPTDTYNALLGYQYANTRAIARSAAKKAVVARRRALK